MVDLSKTFVHCLHCGNRTSEPRNVCPVCDWPRDHSFETAPPTISCADPNAKIEVPAQSGAPAPYIADVKIVNTAPVVIPGQAPARLDAIAEVGVIPASALATLRSLTLAPEDPPPEEPAE